ncbi:MAG: VTT domain-containing protein [Acidobacteriia bacterium]|nr:VTT domain-containing protein [Terriglobia bacterium]
MGHLIAFVVRHGYLLVFFWILAEQGALPLPSIPVLLACGALARSGRLNPLLVVACGVAASLIADSVWFQVGRRRGPKVLRFLCRVALEPDSCVRRTENAFVKYGLRSLLVSKFIPGLNAVAAPLAACSGAGIRRFLMFDAAGAFLWVASYTGLGYAFGGQIEIVEARAAQMGSGLVVLVLALLAAWILWKFVQRRRFLKQLAIARITAEELRTRLNAGEEVTIIDLRTAMDIEPCAIPGVIRIAVEELRSRHREIPRDREIVLFCS